MGRTTGRCHSGCDSKAGQQFPFCGNDAGSQLMDAGTENTFIEAEKMI